MARHLSAVRRGFTLLELIIVLAVLAALAALVVPVLGWVRDQSKFATAAAGAAEALNNLEIYKSATGNYPNRFDSLVNSSGSVYSQVYGGDTGSFVYGTISSGSTPGYFLANGGGMTEVMQHSETATDPNASTEGVAPTAVYDSSGGGAAFAVIDPATANATYAAKMRRIVRAAYPNQTGTGNSVAIPTGHQLVALGIGSRLATSGATMVAAPVHQGAAAGKYGRFIAIFDVSAGATGRGKVQLKMVVDSEFEVLAKNVANYQSTGPTDDQAGP